MSSGDCASTPNPSDDAELEQGGPMERRRASVAPVLPEPASGTPAMASVSDAIEADKQEMIARRPDCWMRWKWLLADFAVVFVFQLLVGMAFAALEPGWSTAPGSNASGQPRLGQMHETFPPSFAIQAAMTQLYFVMGVGMGSPSPMASLCFGMRMFKMRRHSMERPVPLETWRVCCSSYCLWGCFAPANILTMLGCGASDRRNASEHFFDSEMLVAE